MISKKKTWSTTIFGAVLTLLAVLMAFGRDLLSSHVSEESSKPFALAIVASHPAVEPDWREIRRWPIRKAVVFDGKLNKLDELAYVRKAVSRRDQAANIDKDKILKKSVAGIEASKIDPLLIARMVPVSGLDKALIFLNRLSELEVKSECFDNLDWIEASIVLPFRRTSNRSYFDERDKIGEKLRRYRIEPVYIGSDLKKALSQLVSNSVSSQPGFSCRKASANRAVAASEKKQADPLPPNVKDIVITAKYWIKNPAVHLPRYTIVLTDSDGNIIVEPKAKDSKIGRYGFQKKGNFATVSLTVQSPVATGDTFVNLGLENGRVYYQKVNLKVYHSEKVQYKDFEFINLNIDRHETDALMAAMIKTGYGWRRILLSELLMGN